MFHYTVQDVTNAVLHELTELNAFVHRHLYYTSLEQLSGMNKY